MFVDGKINVKMLEFKLLEVRLLQDRQARNLWKHIYTGHTYNLLMKYNQGWGTRGSSLKLEIYTETFLENPQNLILFINRAP